MFTGENKDVATVGKKEYEEFATLLTVFQRLPQMERIAIQYYIKGRVDAERPTVEIPALISHGTPRTAATV